MVRSEIFYLTPYWPQIGLSGGAQAIVPGEVNAVGYDGAVSRPQHPIANVAANVAYLLTRKRWVGSTLPPLVLAAGVGMWSLPIFWWIGAIVAVIGALLIMAVAWWDAQSDDLDTVALARDQVFEGLVAPLLEHAAQTPRMSASDRRSQLEMVAKMVAADLVSAFQPVPEVRVVVYAISDDKQKLTPIAYKGRPHKPGNFVRGTDRGDRAFAVLEGLNRRFIAVPDLSNARPEEWAGSGEGYTTFISAPIGDGKLSYGLLTVDGPVAGSLDAQHGSTMATFAAALGIFFAEAKRSSGGGGTSSTIRTPSGGPSGHN